jgi:hypothetical protein
LITWSITLIAFLHTQHTRQKEWLPRCQALWPWSHPHWPYPSWRGCQWIWHYGFGCSSQRRRHIHPGVGHPASLQHNNGKHHMQCLGIERYLDANCDSPFCNWPVMRLRRLNAIEGVDCAARGFLGGSDECRQAWEWLKIEKRIWKSFQTQGGKKNKNFLHQTLL